ncbi:adenosylcobinamide-phosphate synthase CbiB [Rhizobium sp. L1K21]|uniref:adenosylcobinamide-phosphate synthase CbiB n=1 Tax=Rhizobium sp. L1K21 TaxID=2954933 RepID=UPI0020934BFA|nr:adenosylcobinamide-phosphate synthase CbiB [Rhizobium sp. L1K21]MCO6185803.1 adenosylcobinamide-phosphate synthase CbiB [Rhizobium sp. L1K21]
MFAFRFTCLFLALMIDRVIGDPHWLWSRLPHPVVAFGKVIDFFDHHLNIKGNTPQKLKLAGAISIVLALTSAFLVGYALGSLFWTLGLLGLVLEAIVVSVFLAQKSLADHVRAVADALEDEGLEAGRRAVSMIVGRDPNVLDEAAVSRAAIESLAENFSDGIAAPVFWYVVLGLPGLLAYKMLNTADSMIGHRNDKYLHFGWASARLDDLANWLPARLSILAIAFGALTTGKGAMASLLTALRDHRIHRSPNAGSPEGAMAGALGIRLAGPRIYGGERVDEPFINAEGRDGASPGDIRSGLRVFGGACSILSIAAGVLALITLL